MHRRNRLTRKMCNFAASKKCEYFGAHSDGTYGEVTLTIEPNRELRGKILAYGQYLEVVAPQSLREQIKEIVRLQMEANCRLLAGCSEASPMELVRACHFHKGSSRHPRGHPMAAGLTAGYLASSVLMSLVKVFVGLKALSQ